MRLLLCLTFLVDVFTSSALAAERRCVGTNATVTADSMYDTYLACAGAADAANFLAHQGFVVDTVVHIDVRETVYLHAKRKPDFRILGRFEPEQNLVLVTSTLSQRSMAQEKPILGIPYEEALFRSVVAHEVAHAIAEDNFHIAEPTRVAHEYIAYIVQLATLPRRLRQQILDRHTADAFENEWEINPMVYGLNPEAFAVKAFRHYSSPGVGAAFLQTLLSRDLLSMFPQFETRTSLDPITGGQLAGHPKSRGRQ